MNTSTAVMQRRHSAVDALDYFPTPPWATRGFLAEVMLPRVGADGFGRVWEPAAGEGHMLHVLSEFADEVYGSDVHDYGRGLGVGSFVGEGLDVIPSKGGADWIITNPPFNLAVEFFERAWKDAGWGVAFLLRTSWLEGGERYARIFKSHPPTLVAQYCERVPMVAGKWDPAASSATSYAWFVWDKHSPQPNVTELVWIAPGLRDRHSRPEDLKRWAA